MECLISRRENRGAFTLIELLVVIAVIAILIGMLLPAIGKSRESGQQIACMINLKSLSLSAATYANDHKETIWYDFWRIKSDNPALNDTPDTNLTWCVDKRTANKVPGVVFQYLEHGQKVFECPKNKRRGTNNRTYRKTSDSNLFPGTGALDFDYAMATYTGGAKLGMNTKAGWVTPATNTPPKNLPAAEGKALNLFRGVPIFIEESTYWYNDEIQDGLCGNADQITQRHNNGGMIAFLSGEAEVFRPPAKQSETLPDTRTLNFCMNDVYVSSTYAPTDWWALYNPAANANKGHKLGWINNPKRD